jgi:hypothetical protein
MIELVSRWRYDGRGRQQPADLRRRRIGGSLQRHIAGQHQHRHAAFADRFTDGNLERARHLVGTRHKFTIVTALLEEPLRMRLLKIAAADLRRWNVCGDAEYRNA